jgi:hypothetical protein
VRYVCSGGEAEIKELPVLLALLDCRLRKGSDGTRYVGNDEAVGIFDCVMTTLCLRASGLMMCRLLVTTKCSELSRASG